MERPISVCSKCGERFETHLGRIAGALSYCGYCEAVIFSPGHDYPQRISEAEYRELEKTWGLRVVALPEVK